MSTTNGIAAVELFGAHEDRLNRLEGDSGSLREDVAACRSDIRHMHSGIDALEDKLDGLDGKMDALKTSMDKQGHDSADRFTKMLDRVDMLEDDKRATDARWALWKKSASWILTATGGAILAKYGNVLYDWLNR